MTQHNSTTDHPQGHPNERTDPPQNPAAHPTPPTRHPHHHHPPPTPKTSSTFEMGVWGSGPTSWGGTYAAAPPPPPPPPPPAPSASATWTPNYPPGLYTPSYHSHTRNKSHQQLWFQNQQFSRHLQPQRSYVGGDHQPLYGQHANQVSRTSRGPTMADETDMPKPRKCVRFAEDGCPESFRK